MPIEKKIIVSKQDESFVNVSETMIYDLIKKNFSRRKVFEVPKNQAITFELVSVSGVRNRQATKHRVYWIKQNSMDFKTNEFLPWEETPEMPLHKYLDYLDQTENKWRDRGVGKNYFRAFDVKYGESIYKGNLSLEYHGSEEGKGIWLEVFNYYPEFGTQGAFVIPVADPYIKALTVVEMLGQESVFCNYDIETVGLKGIVHYGDFVEVILKVHNILLDDFDINLELSCEGHMLTKERFTLKHLQKEPGTLYNAIYKFPLYIDMKGIETLGHEPGSDKEYIAKVTCTPKDPNCFSYQIDPSVLEMDYSFQVHYKEAWSFNVKEAEAIPQIAMIKDAQVVTMEHDECKFTRLAISHNNEEGERKYIILEERDGCLVKNENIPTFDLIGDEDPIPVTLDITGLTRVDCIKDGEHSHKNQSLIVSNLTDNTDQTIDLSDGDISVSFHVESRVENSSSAIPSIIGSILPVFVSPDTYRTHIATCSYARPLLINVYPNIEWEVAFMITIGNTYSGNLKYKRSELNEYHKEHSFNYIKKKLSIGATQTGTLVWAVKAKCAVNGKEYEVERALKSLKHNVEKARLAYEKVCEYLDVFNHKKIKDKGAAVKKGILKLEFAIDPPNIGLALGWKYGYASNKELVPIYRGGLKLDPLIGISIGVDLVPLVNLIPTVGSVISWILDILGWLTKSDVYLIFKSFLAAKCEFGLSYNKIDGFGTGQSHTTEMEVGVSIEAGIKSNDTVFVTTTTRADTGITDTIEVEKFKVEGKIQTSFSFIEEIGYENNKQYRESKVIWNGAKITITIYELISRKKLDYDDSKSFSFNLFEKENIYKNKTYLYA